MTEAGPRSSKISSASLREVQETLLMPLWSRAKEARHPEPILRDEKAAEIVAALDYDFQRFEHRGVDPVGYCSRAAVMDQLVREFLQGHPQAVVVEIGAGLDARFERVDNGAVRWVDLDLPEAMGLRRRFFQESPRRKMIAVSVLEEDWLEEIAVEEPSSLLLVAEGVFYFFTEGQLRELFARFASRWPGMRLLFDCQSPWFLWYSRWKHPLRNSKLIWSLGNPRELESWQGPVRVEKVVGFGDRPYYERHLHRFPLLYRWGRKLIPGVRNFFKLVMVRLGG